MNTKLKLTINNDSKISFFRDCQKAVTLKMALLMCIMIAKVDNMAIITLEREEPCMSPSPKNVKVLLDRLHVTECSCFTNRFQIISIKSEELGEKIGCNIYT